VEAMTHEPLAFDTTLKSEIFPSKQEIRLTVLDEHHVWSDRVIFWGEDCDCKTKEEAIKDIGGEDAFNQEYGLRFINASKSLLSEAIIDELLKKRVLAKFELTLCEKKWYSWIKAILVISTYNFFSILLSLFFLSLIGMLLMQSCFIDAFGIFNFEFDVFSENQIINEFLNIIAKPLGLAENFKIIPKNAIATLLLIFFKCIYLLIAVNFMFEKIKDNLIR
jgi:hypothetical protein